MAAPLTHSAWNGWVEQVVREVRSAERGRYDPDHFRCFLEDQPGLLVPARLAMASNEGKQSQNSLRWNLRCKLCAPGELPAELKEREEWRDGFALDAFPIAWVQAAAGNWQPFWMGPETVERLIAWRKSGDAARRLAPALRRVLVAAGILANEEEAARKHASWTRAAEEGRRRFARDGYLPVNGFIHPYHMGELRRYYRRLIRRGGIALGDYQSARRYVAHNEPVVRFFHLQLTAAVAQLAGEPVKPSYVYFASYQSGAELKRHTDRAQCEFSITLCLDYAPEPEGATPWPLLLDSPRGRVTVRQALGDALLYRGRALPHYRHRLADGHTSTSVFFHYVRENFRGGLT